jgi:glycosyltransferase involved in cell wall biosynthesis
VEKVHDLARGLVALGHSVAGAHGRAVLSARPGVRGLPASARGSGKKSTACTFCACRRFPITATAAIKRAIYYGSFAVSATAFGPAHLEPADVMLVYQAALPVGLCGVGDRAACAGFRSSSDVVDLWPESVLASGISKSARLARVVRRAAKWVVYSKADHISVITEGYRDNLIDMGCAGREAGRHLSVDCRHRPTGRVHPIRSWRLARGLTGRFNIVYAWQHRSDPGARRRPRRGRDAARSSPVQFVIVGSGAERERLIASARSRRLDNVRFLERRPPEDMPALYALADALLRALRPDPMSRISIPSKLFRVPPERPSDPSRAWKARCSA